MPIQCKYTSPDGLVEVRFDAPDWAGMLVGIGQCRLVNETLRCQKCAEESRGDEYGVLLQKRISGGFTYYEAACQHPECGATFGFGQRQQDNLFYPKRYRPKDKGGGALPHQGWTVWEASESYSGGGGSPSPPPPAPAPPAPQPPPQPVQQPAAPTAPPVAEDDIPFIWVLWAGGASILGVMMANAQDVFQVWC